MNPNIPVEQLLIDAIQREQDAINGLPFLVNDLRERPATPDSRQPETL